MIAISGGLIVLISSLLLYLAAPHQKLLQGSSLSRPIAWAGLVGLIVGTALLMRWAGSATSIFIAMTVAMAFWSVIPLAIAWWRGAPESKS